MLNNLKTVILLGLMSALLVIICEFIGAIFNFGRFGIIIGLIFAIIMNFTSYFYSDSIALSSYNAKIVSGQEYPNLHRIITDLSNKADIKKPRVAIIQSNDPNAFATGRNQNHATVAVTTGLLQMLNEDELRGVISHELGHIKNHDILISSIAATIGAMIVAIANWSSYAILFANNDDDNANLIGSLLITILAPISASIIQFAISRSREYNADATGAKICGNPLILASALRKIEFSIIQNPMKDAKPTDAHMFILNPFGNRGGKLQNLFSTHPKTADRIKKLEEMANSQSY